MISSRLDGQQAANDDVRLVAAADGKWRLHRTVQCEKCPWRKDTDPREIPRGYSEEKHRELSAAIAKPDPSPQEIMEMLSERTLRVMACHDDHASMCIGWLHHQRREGNNIGLRLHLMSCVNLSAARVCGEQHATFEDTLPTTPSSPGANA